MPIESTKYFHETINRELGTGLRILESNRFAVDPDFQGRQSLFARFLLFRAHGLNAEAHGCSHIITSVRDSHRAFYLRFLGMPSLSEHPVYIPWVDTEGYLLANDIETCRKNFLKWGVPDYSQSDVRQFIQCAQLAISVRQSAA
jgi:hypothetical protein